MIVEVNEDQHRVTGGFFNEFEKPVGSHPDLFSSTELESQGKDSGSARSRRGEEEGYLLIDRRGSQGSFSMAPGVGDFPRKSQRLE